VDERGVDVCDGSEDKVRTVVAVYARIWGSMDGQSAGAVATC
jgi:hypothetical protein